jgi:hypothetical protein
VDRDVKSRPVTVDIDTAWFLPATHSLDNGDVIARLGDSVTGSLRVVDKICHVLGHDCNTGEESPFSQRAPRSLCNSDATRLAWRARLG